MSSLSSRCTRSIQGSARIVATIAAFVGMLLGMGSGVAAGESAPPPAASVMVSWSYVDTIGSLSQCVSRGENGIGKFWSAYECRNTSSGWQLWVKYGCLVCKPTPEAIRE